MAMKVGIKFIRPESLLAPLEDVIKEGCGRYKGLK